LTVKSKVAYDSVTMIVHNIVHKVDAAESSSYTGREWPRARPLI